MKLELEAKILVAMFANMRKLWDECGLTGHDASLLERGLNFFTIFLVEFFY